jgi:hypothetical protein
MCGNAGLSYCDLTRRNLATQMCLFIITEQQINTNVYYKYRTSVIISNIQQLTLDYFRMCASVSNQSPPLYGSGRDLIRYTMPEFTCVTEETREETR